MATTAPAGVVPRWEWRTFGDDLRTVGHALTAAEQVAVQDSAEHYVLSLRSDASVKVRDGLMDVKHLLAVDADGLQQWAPVLKAPFPLHAEDVALVLRTLELTVPPAARADYSLAQLEYEIVERDASVRLVDVAKHRRRHRTAGCMVELTDVTAAGRSTQTIAVESEDAAAVAALVRELGLADRANTSMAAGLKALIEFAAPRYAVIDVGTNSVKFHLAERVGGGPPVVVDDHAAVTRLGESQAADGTLAAVAMRRTADAVVAMVTDARARGASAIAAVGTAGLRRAPNRAEFVDAVRDRCGVTVEVISGEEEARVAYLAATSAVASPGGRLVVFDSGGGSSQFTFGRDGAIDEQFSLDVGAVGLAERFGLDRAVDADVVRAACADVAERLTRVGGHPAPDAVVGIGGTATNLAAVHLALVTYDPDAVHGTRIDAAELDRQLDLYRTLDADGRRAITGLQPDRAEVILAGACIVRAILSVVGADAMTVSDRGVRHGVALERFGG